MLTAQIGFEANNINTALDQLKWTRRRSSRKALLGQALQASKRALEELRQEPLITDTQNYVRETLERHNCNPRAVTEELRLDGAAIRWFIKAECDLLRTQGFNADLVEAIEGDMLDVLQRSLTEPIEFSLEARFQELAERVDQNLTQLRDEAHRGETHRTLAIVLGVLGGCGVVAADTAAAAATAGTTAPILAVSVPLGSSMIDLALSALADN